MRAGTTVSTPTMSTAPIAVAASHQIGGVVIATSTATPATARRHSSQLATIITSCSFLTRMPSCWLMSRQTVR
jgi:hypothetical protein